MQEGPNASVQWNEDMVEQSNTISQKKNYKVVLNHALGFLYWNYKITVNTESRFLLS